MGPQLEIRESCLAIHIDGEQLEWHCTTGSHRRDPRRLDQRRHWLLLQAALPYLANDPRESVKPIAAQPI